MWMDALSEAGVLADNCTTVAYSYIGPELTHPIYKDGTIGRAKIDLEEACARIDKKLGEKGGRAFVSVNKAVVTQASSAIIAGFVFGVEALEWCALVLCIALVFAAEGMNTAIESLADAVHPDQHPLVGRAKDVAAGAVLLCAIGSAVVGAIIFLPYLGLNF